MDRGADMFVYTAKLSRKRVLIAVLLAAAVIAAILFLTLDGGKAEEAVSSSAAKTNRQRVEYLESLGWEVFDEPIETQNIIIPETFDSVYAEYAALQESQGFDLRRYAGMEATRYTYAVENHPDSTEQVYADLLVCKGKIIAGDVQCIALDGFMHGLAFPEDADVFAPAENAA